MDSVFSGIREYSSDGSFGNTSRIISVRESEQRSGTTGRLVIGVLDKHRH